MGSERAGGGADPSVDMSLRHASDSERERRGERWRNKTGQMNN